MYIHIYIYICIYILYIYAYFVWFLWVCRMGIRHDMIVGCVWKWSMLGMGVQSIRTEGNWWSWDDPKMTIHWSVVRFFLEGLCGEFLNFGFSFFRGFFFSPQQGECLQLILGPDLDLVSWTTCSLRLAYSERKVADYRSRVGGLGAGINSCKDQSSRCFKVNVPNPRQPVPPMINIPAARSQHWAASGKPSRASPMSAAPIAGWNHCADLFRRMSHWYLTSRYFP